MRSFASAVASKLGPIPDPRYFVATPNGIRVAPEPDLPNVEVVSRVKAVPGPCESWRQGITYDVQASGLLATVSFNGSFPAACGERGWRGRSVFHTADPVGAA